MHCYICVTYMIILCSAHPTKDREVASPQQKRSLFRDVIESFRIRAQLPENLNQNLENNLSNQNYDRYGYENELPQLPGDSDFIPRRNDRIEMPPLKYRFPKSLSENSEQKANETKEEIVLYIETSTSENKVTRTTQKPKRQKRPQPSANKNKYPSKNKQEEIDETATQLPDYVPMTNNMAGQSQIGHRETQTVVKPTVIVNFRGTLSHRDSDIRIESRTDNDTLDTPEPAQNIFNINQEVNFEHKKETVPKNVFRDKEADVRQQISIKSAENKTKIEEDMLMCETATWLPQKKVRTGRKFDNVFQILFSL